MPDGVVNQTKSSRVPGSVIQSSAGGRLSSVDVVRGIAIILMVFGHTEQGGNHRHWWDAFPRFFPFINFADSFIYSFHMAVFFVLSGLFVVAAIARCGPLGFTGERVRVLLYPYLLWGLIQGLTDPLTAPFRVNVEPFSLRHLVIGLLNGSSSWFLPTLFLCGVLASLVRFVPAWLQISIALCGSLFASFSGDYPRSLETIYETLRYFPFLLIGMVIGAKRFAQVETLSRKRSFAGFAILLAFQIVAIWKVGDSPRVAFVPLGLTGTAMLVLLASCIRGTRASAVLRWSGEASIAIFLIAPIMQGTGRELVLRLLHSTHPLPQLLVPVVLATVVPALLWHGRQMLHLNWLFRWPSHNKAGTA